MAAVSVQHPRFLGELVPLTNLMDLLEPFDLLVVLRAFAFHLLPFQTRLQRSRVAYVHCLMGFGARGERQTAPLFDLQVWHPLGSKDLLEMKIMPWDSLSLVVISQHLVALLRSA